MAKTESAAYAELVRRMREVALLASAEGILGWDQETHLPAGGVQWRAEQLAILSGLSHRRVVDPEVGELLKVCEGEGLSEQPGAVGANVRGLRREYERARRLPAELVEAFEKARSLAVAEWRTARAERDFGRFAPHLEGLLELSRRKAELWGYADEPYDALVEEYEPGETAKRLAPVLVELARSVSSLVRSIGDAGPGRGALAGEYPEAEQERFNRRVAEAIGFDFARGRIDTTTHPFCGGYGPSDTRLTTRYDPKDFAVSLFGVLHEAGHGLYEQGLVTEEWGLPAGTSCSLGIHESQSRTWENKVGRSRVFWERWFPVACEHFPSLRSHTVDSVLAAVNAVRPTFIRVEADEVTYDLHIALRFEIERALVAGDLEVAGVPAAWNARFRELTGLEVPHDADGCLQDVHWSFGLFGYFATYTLGNLASSQLWARLQADTPDLEARLAEGGYGVVLEWMRTRVHRLGRELTPAALIESATGKPLSPEPHLEYLRTKFGGGA